MTDAAPPPINLRYEGEGEFKPTSPFWGKRADRFYVVGETYDLVTHQERSSASHAHYFASVNEAWKNLPEDMAERWPSPEHLRKWALIKAGYCVSTTVLFANRKDAEKAAALVIPLDEFSVVDVKETTLTRYVAKSQSYRAMPKGEFQRSKDDVLRVLDELLGTVAGAVAEAGRNAA